MKYLLLVLAAVFGGTAGAVVAAEGPNDAQIAHIAYTADTLDIDAAHQALEKSSNPEVRAFAETMVRDHTAVNDKALALVKKLGVTPEDNATSKALSADAAATLAKLAKLEGAAYDKAYVENEVAYHKTVNEALESTLIPGADNAELKSLLQSGQALFRSHQQHAEQLARDLR
jgi:putative membrane protein